MLTELKDQSPALATEPLAPPAARLRQSPLRIMHVVNYLRRGGMEFGILKLMAAFDREQFDHRFCITRKFDDDFVAAYDLRKIVDLAAGSKVGLQFPLFRLRRIFQARRPHIVHTRNWGALEAVLAARLAGVPVVIHSEHGYELEILRGLPIRQRLFRKIAYRMTDAVCTVTRELRDYHARQSWTCSERFQVIYNGVDTERFAPSSEVRTRVRQECGIPDAACVLGSVGRMVPIKDYPTLLRAAAHLLARRLDVRVLLVGSGPELDALKQQAEAKALKGRVLFVGASDRVPDLLKVMDIFVLPSRGEGMSNTLLEAMASGLPVAATNVGGNPEVVGDQGGGFLFKPGDVEGLTATLQTWIETAELRGKFGAAARDRVCAHFSLRTMIEQYKTLYLKAAKKKGLAVSI